MKQFQTPKRNQFANVRHNLILHPMRTIITFCMILSFNYIYCQNQEIEQLIKAKEKLEKKKTILNDSIKIIESKIDYLISLKKLNVVTDKYIVVKINQRGNIKKTPRSEGIIIKYIEAWDSVRVYDYYDGFWLVEKDSEKGYMYDMYFPKNDFLNNLITNAKIRKIEQEKKDLVEIEKLLKERKDRIIKKYGQVNGQKIIDQKIWIGMTEEMLIESWGKPDEINRTVTKNGELKQCIYSSAYVYVENGVVTSWQDKL